MAEVTYYWNAYKGTSPFPWTDRAKIVDGNLATSGYTFSVGNYTRLTAATCDGTDLGTITKVEIRCYGYGDGNDRIDLSVGLTPTTPEYQLTMPSSEGWSGYVDVTDDPKVGGWRWVDVANINNPTLGMFLILEYDKVAKSNTMYCAKVEIRVTYTPAPPGYPYHRRTLKGTGPYSGRRGFDEITGHRRGFWPTP